MIAGNPNTGRKICIVAVCFFLLLITTVGILAVRRKSAPQHEQPLHPSTLMTKIFASSASQSNFLNG